MTYIINSERGNTRTVRSAVSGASLRRLRYNFALKNAESHAALRRNGIFACTNNVTFFRDLYE
jgi:hypothetical protein